MSVKFLLIASSLLMIFFISFSVLSTFIIIDEKYYLVYNKMVLGSNPNDLTDN
ncbi:MAG: hypothetical protein ACR2KZ_11565 [Segetibacter sp.]